MAVLIKSTDDKKINLVIEKSSIDLVYARINFKAYPDGRTIEIGLDVYLNKEKFIEGSTILTDIPDHNFFVKIETTSESQSLDYAHVYTIQYFEDMGYECKIV